MKSILFLLIVIATAVQGQSIRINGEDMSLLRLNFGVKTPVLRTTLGHFTQPASTVPEKAYGHFGNSESGMLTNIRFNSELLIMVNNQNLLPDEDMKRPKFIFAGFSYDDLLKRANLNISYAQSTECLFSFMGFINMKGYWHVGVDGRFDRSKYQTGLRAGFNGYSRHIGFESSLRYYANKSEVKSSPMVINIQLYRSLYKGLLVNGGLYNNLPNAGLCVLSKRKRFGLNGFYDGKLHFGGSFTLNL